MLDTPRDNRTRCPMGKVRKNKMHPMGSANEAQFRVQVRDGSEQK